MSLTTMSPPGGYASKVDSALDRNKLTGVTVILMVVAALPRPASPRP